MSGSSSDPTGEATSSCRVVGLLAAPELAMELAEELAPRLPAVLADHHGGRWEVPVADDPLVEGENGVEEILDAGGTVRRREGWDAAVCLTDVPLRDGQRPLVAAASPDDRVAVVTVPAFGPTRLTPRVREAAVALVADLSDEALDGGEERALVRRRPGDVLTPIRRQRDGDGDRPAARYVMPAATGHLRLLTGMVRANRPWRALSGLSSAVVGAFATGAYALVNSTIWRLSSSLSTPRLAGMMGGALLAVLAWLIVAHDLWERPRSPTRRKDAALYNSATVLTLLLAVLVAYAVLFVLVLGAAALVVDGSSYRQYAGTGVDALQYALLAWFAASMATVAGALGSGLESMDEVREAAYGHRQRARAEERQDRDRS